MPASIEISIKLFVCPDDELADGHHMDCQYSRMAEVMEQLDAARDELFDQEDELVGRVKP
jgi:hypothetical protein